jgi:hypothetical protein
MNSLVLTGTIIVFFALSSYSIFIYNEQRKKQVVNKVLIFLTLGIVLDLTATTFMILGSTKGFLTLHGVLGYSSLLGMFADTVMIWKLQMKNGLNAEIPHWLHLYSRYAYIWWVLAFITGGLLVAFRI